MLRGGNIVRLMISPKHLTSIKKKFKIKQENKMIKKKNSKEAKPSNPIRPNLITRFKAKQEF